MMTGVVIWGLEGGWKETEKVHKMFLREYLGYQIPLQMEPV
jgi:hypothetical protein